MCEIRAYTSQIHGQLGMGEVTFTSNSKAFTFPIQSPGSKSSHLISPRNKFVRTGTMAHGIQDGRKWFGIWDFGVFMGVSSSCK